MPDSLCAQLFPFERGRNRVVIAISKLACFIVQEKKFIWKAQPTWTRTHSKAASHVGYKSCLSDDGKATGLPSALFFKPDTTAAAPELFARI